MAANSLPNANSPYAPVPVHTPLPTPSSPYAPVPVHISYTTSAKREIASIVVAGLLLMLTWKTPLHPVVFGAFLLIMLGLLLRYSGNVQASVQGVISNL